jgi:mono/diheme cytochrome c family protein
VKNIVQSKRYKKFWISGVALFVLLALSACKSIKPPDSLVNDTDIKLESGSKKLDPYLGFNKAYTLAAASAADRTLDASLRQADLLAEGMALVKANCSSYFTRLGNDGQHLGFVRKETSLLGAATAAVMGLYDATTKVLSATASAFGFTTASMDNFSDTYLFSPDIKSVQELVMSALDAKQVEGLGLVDQVQQHRKTLTYTEANQFLLEMESTCQPHGIRSLINQAVNTQRAVPAYPVASAPASSSSSALGSSRSQAIKLVNK